MQCSTSREVKASYKPISSSKLLFAIMQSRCNVKCNGYKLPEDRVDQMFQQMRNAGCKKCFYGTAYQ